MTVGELERPDHGGVAGEGLGEKDTADAAYLECGGGVVVGEAGMGLVGERRSTGWSGFEHFKHL
jgi:hypothetical protein